MTDWPRDPETDEERHKARVAALQLMFADVDVVWRLRALNEAFDDVKSIPTHLHGSLMQSAVGLQREGLNTSVLVNQIINGLSAQY